jgi:D-alanine-D-alanine ligase
VDGKSSTQVPAELDCGTAQKIRDMARRAFSSIDGYGLARVDFFLERETGNIDLNEMNTIPGFTSISMFPKLLEAAGIPYQDQITALIDLAMARHKQTTAKLVGYKSGSEWFKS